MYCLWVDRSYGINLLTGASAGMHNFHRIHVVYIPVRKALGLSFLNSFCTDLQFSEVNLSGDDIFIIIEAALCKFTPLLDHNNKMYFIGSAVERLDHHVSSCIVQHYQLNFVNKWQIYQEQLNSLGIALDSG